MRRRDFITLAGGLAGAALAVPTGVTPALAAPALVPARRITIALPGSAAGLDAVAAAYRRAAGDIPLHPVGGTGPYDAVRTGAADLALLPLADLVADCPGTGVIAGLPFGPAPETLAAWMEIPASRRLWDAALAPAGLAAIPVAMAPAGRAQVTARLSGLGDLTGVAVAAPGPTARLWRRLGAADHEAVGEAKGGAPAIRDGRAEGLRGFGPRTRPVALLIGPGVPAGTRGTLERAARSLLAARWERPGPTGALEAELMVAAGNALPCLRGELMDGADPTCRSILADLLPLCGVEDAVLADAWPWSLSPPAPAV